MMQQQPYRKGPREPGAALTAMLKGRAAGASDMRQRLKVTTKTTRSPRQSRPTRPTRPTR